MEYRPSTVVAGLILALLAVPALADEADWQRRLERARSMQDEAQQRQKAADAEFEQRSLACQSKFMVSGCVDDARKAHIAVTRETRQLRIDADALEREVKREQVKAREQERAAAAEVRERDLAERERRIAGERAAAEQARQEAAAAKAEKAAAGARRKAEQAEAHRRKVADHEARVAGKKARAAARSGGD
jgi:outer membrane murein-binding lipoprotein Lpp